MKYNRMFVFAVVFVALTVVACGGGSDSGSGDSADTAASTAAPAAAPAPSGPTGSVGGTVTYVNGDSDVAIDMGADPACQSMHTEDVHTEKVVVTDGNLANAFVYVKSGLTGSHPAPADTKLLDQKGCQYLQHVSGVQVDQTLIIRNSDPVLHNVHAIPTLNAEFNNGQPFEGMELEHAFDQAEVMIPLKCDVHPWMASYVGVLDHPFYTTSGVDGSFSIDGLPAGDYVLEAWHEEFGTKTVSVTVAADAAAEASFDFSPTAG